MYFGRRLQVRSRQTWMETFYGFMACVAVSPPDYRETLTRTPLGGVCVSVSPV